MTYIESKDKEKCPDRMYMYYRKSEYALESIENDSVYFCAVSNFNDPFECYNEVLYIANPKYFGMVKFVVLQNALEEKTDEKLENTKRFDIYNEILGYLMTNRLFVELTVKDFDFMESKRDLFNYLSKQISESDEPIVRLLKEPVIRYFCKKWNLQEYAQGMIEYLTKDYSGKVKMQDSVMKVACFTEDKKSVLMWAYYGDNHKGICVEYDFTDEEKKNKMHRVQYRKNRDFHSKNWYKRKAICWNHEAEWRMVRDGFELDIDIPVKNIYFGLKFDYVNNEFYLKILEVAQRRGIGLYKAIQNTNDYKIEFVPLFGEEH